MNVNRSHTPPHPNLRQASRIATQAADINRLLNERRRLLAKREC